MKKYDWFIDEMNNVLQSINGEYLPAVMELNAQYNVSFSTLNCCQLAQSEAPEPMHVGIIKERGIYTSDERIEQSLRTAAEEGFLTAVPHSPHTYILTEKGTELANAVIDSIMATAQEVNPLSPKEMEQLVEYLERLRNAALHSDAPQKACLQRSLFFDQGETTPLAEKIRRRLNDLAAFRDDVHMASWAKHGIDGAAWDAFSHIVGNNVYGEPVNNAAGLAEKMPFHGYTADQYATHLQTIVDKGWLLEENGRYTPTDKGRAIRKQAEEETDRLFYQGWNLTDNEIGEMRSLMSKLVAAAAPPNLNDLYDLALETRAAIGSLYGEKLQTMMTEAGLHNWGLLLLMMAKSIDPKPLSTAVVLHQIPYMNATTVDSTLTNLASEQYITQEEGAYRLTERGEAIVADSLDAVSNWVDVQLAVEDGLLINVQKLLQKLSNRIEMAQEPKDKPAYTSARNLAPAPKRPILLHISRSITELAAFRDDVHLAAFAKHEVPAHEWEAFSHIWGEKTWGERVNTAVDIANKLAFRGFDQSDYTDALQASIQRGWLEKSQSGIYTLTEKGRTVREEAEQETNRLFFAPWQHLAPRELNQLQTGLAQIKEALT